MNPFYYKEEGYEPLSISIAGAIFIVAIQLFYDRLFWSILDCVKVEMK